MPLVVGHAAGFHRAARRVHAVSLRPRYQDVLRLELQRQCNWRSVRKEVYECIYVLYTSEWYFWLSRKSECVGGKIAPRIRAEFES